ncbi:hypothetical protein JQX09_24600 [Sulfitobacter pseudonitzschiae]|uniref:hypothetical protein n=1 Tax=Pseudosulfitobacter pseudonitzschiae TaxID=1402135 RepID=UPI001AFAC409|nr:hypothetical protein [Pseudosulfitobacter pseudonitzschiae]MBM2295100.1 hypothetical protein [Pseudosulfitobacter pseudonitzschiae]MBM2300037.1 hypothetical protein [Pseudosulfitobacter pseudonitzschiae]MBM2304938.1 hypothetical protein [Pseudosulfitobacter pseudonitzschiae]MBM2314711.1 hypothetical protein [Pseudosulfitobacter pseudonitzschiae]MBM2319619.1 hypothetical protein [Pseudosulfitobacter pseudonitzschiae]
MQWSSDTFTLEDARGVLALFAPDKVTEDRCKRLCNYLEEIPPPHTVDAYVNYYEQITPAAIRVQETGHVDAELWFYALSVRALSYEVEQEFHGPMKQLICGDPPADQYRDHQEGVV